MLSYMLLLSVFALSPCYTVILITLLAAASGDCIQLILHPWEGKWLPVALEQTTSVRSRRK